MFHWTFAIPTAVDLGSLEIVISTGTAVGGLSKHESE